MEHSERGNDIRKFRSLDDKRRSEVPETVRRVGQTVRDKCREG